MWLICGLGNPGHQYQGTRHNIGFMVIDRLAERARAPSFSAKFKGEISTCRLAGEQVLLLKPLTFMNLSGESVQAAMAFYKLEVDNLIVVHDEIDLELGQLKLKKGGGAAGHNGIKSIAGLLGPEFVRIRAGVGRPAGKRSVSSHVLGGFSPEEQIEIDLLLDKTCDAIEAVLTKGLVMAQTRFQEKKKQPPKKPTPPPTPKSESKPSDSAESKLKPSDQDAKLTQP